jgi:hypothetical protein
MSAKEQTIADMAAEIEGFEVAEQGNLEATIARYRDMGGKDTWVDEDGVIQLGASNLKKQRDKLGEALKSWLNAHPDESLYDAEHGLEAKMQRRRAGAPVYDMPAIRKVPGLIERLLDLGVLEVNATLLAEHIKSSNVTGVPRPTAGGEIYALVVEARK